MNGTVDWTTGRWSIGATGWSNEVGVANFLRRPGEIRHNIIMSGTHSSCDDGLAIRNVIDDLVYRSMNSREPRNSLGAH